MFRRLLASRGFVSILGAAVVAAIAAGVGLVLLAPMKDRIAYCAIMPDAIGLYVGNDATLRGIKVGTVTGIRTEGTQVHVSFDVDADHPLRGDSTATTISDTIVADRRLALNDRGGPVWEPTRCITETATPKSLTQTLDALANLADELDGGDDPTQRDAIKFAVSEFDRATVGTGPKLNDVITQLAAALRSPDAAIGRIGSLIDTLSSLSQSVANGWGDLRNMLADLAPVLELVNEIWAQIMGFVNSLVVILPWLNDITTKYGGAILGLLDKTVPFLDLVAANVGTLEKLIDMTPALASAFRTVSDPQTGLPMVAYAAPRVPLDPAIAGPVCSALNAAASGTCAEGGGGLSTVDVGALVFGVSGGGQ